MRTNGGLAARWVLAAAAALIGMTMPATATEFVVNGSFEADTFAVYPGYASDNGNAISGWTLSDTSCTGLNPAGGASAFANNGIVPNGTNVAFLQRLSGQPAPSISQTISGLTTGTVYRLSLRCNTRAEGAGSASGIGVAVDGVDLIAYSNMAPAGAAGTTNPYYAVACQFLPTGATAVIKISNINTSFANGTLLVDKISVSASSSSQIVNGSFEDNAFLTYPGYAVQSGNGPISGWAISDTDLIGLNPASSSPFADNGSVPDGTNVVFMQKSGASDPELWISQTMYNLTPGQAYFLSLRYNARSSGSVSPSLDVSVNGTSLVAVATMDPVGDTKAYYSILRPFVAGGATAVVKIANNNTTHSGNSTLLVDDIRVLAAPPGQIFNGSFETNTFTTSPGLAVQSGNGPIGGWTISDAGLIGLNPASDSPYADNGIVPDGTNVVFLQKHSVSDPDVWINQTVYNLRPGRSYLLSLRYNARSAYSVPSSIDVSVDGTSLFSAATVTPLESSGSHTQPYYSATNMFTAAGSTAVIKIANNNTTQAGDSTLLVDDVRINVYIPRGTIFTIR